MGRFSNEIVAIKKEIDAIKNKEKPKNPEKSTFYKTIAPIPEKIKESVNNYKVKNSALKKDMIKALNGFDQYMKDYHKKVEERNASLETVISLCDFSEILTEILATEGLGDRLKKTLDHTKEDVTTAYKQLTQTNNVLNQLTFAQGIYTSMNNCIKFLRSLGNFPRELDEKFYNQLEPLYKAYSQGLEQTKIVDDLKNWSFEGRVIETATNRYQQCLSELTEQLKVHQPACDNYLNSRPKIVFPLEKRKIEVARRLKFALNSRIQTLEGGKWNRFRTKINQFVNDWQRRKFFGDPIPQEELDEFSKCVFMNFENDNKSIS